MTSASPIAYRAVTPPEIFPEGSNFLVAGDGKYRSTVTGSPRPKGSGSAGKGRRPTVAKLDERFRDEIDLELSVDVVESLL